MIQIVMILQYPKLCCVPHGLTCQTARTVKLLTSLLLGVLRKNGHSCQKCLNICYSSTAKDNRSSPLHRLTDKVKCRVEKERQKEMQLKYT